MKRIVDKLIDAFFLAAFPVIAAVCIAAMVAPSAFAQVPIYTRPNSANSVSPQAFPLLAPDGTASAPSYAFSANPNTGLYNISGYPAITNGGTGLFTCGSVLAAAFNGCRVVNGLTFGSAVTSDDVAIKRDAANTLAQVNGTNAQTSRIYNTFTNASNYERLGINWNSNVIQILSEAAGTGVVRDFQFGSTGSVNINFVVGGGIRWVVNSSNNLVTGTDNSFDIGASGATRPRNVYVGTSVTSPTYLTTAPNTQTGTTYTVATTDSYLIFNGSASTTVTLPAASSFTGRRIVLKTIAAFTVVSASSNVVPQATATAGTAILAATAGKFAELVSDGTNWITFAAN